ncbi:lipoate-protein ligase A [Arthrobacter sp. CAN_A6]|uniref:lipoate--protein ligase family protein n=1 Tax=Arthrobacter sp. CAN_A6 TaxID=2787721 RepID=UPI0018CB79E3
MTNAWSGSGTLTVQRLGESAGAAEDLDAGIELLRKVGAGTTGATLRLYRPAPTMAFGQRDSRLPGFPAAAAACLDQGFEPLVRRAGGRAAAYHQGCLVVDHVEPHADAVARTKARFVAFGNLFAESLQDLGIDAAVGEIPGEYCPGEFSVHGTGEHRPPAEPLSVKLVGTAQRVISGAWLFSSVIVVEDSAPIRRALTSAYSALGLDWDPRTAGAAEDLVPGITVDDVEAAVLRAYARTVDLA